MNRRVKAVYASRNNCTTSAVRWRLRDTREVAYSPGPNPNPSVDEELRRWLAIRPGADAAAGFRAGWARLGRFVGPRLRDWEARFERSRRDNAGLKSHIVALTAEIQKLQSE